MMELCHSLLLELPTDYRRESMNESLINLISQTGIWCAAAFVLGKVFLDYVNKKDEQTRQDTLAREDRIYTILEKLEDTMSQQKDILTKQTITTEHNKLVLDKLTDIQMLHTNRLDKIEDRLARLEDRKK